MSITTSTNPTALPSQRDRSAISTAKAEPAYDQGRGSSLDDGQPVREAAHRVEAKEATGRHEWLIDDSTRELYLSLLVNTGGMPQQPTPANAEPLPARPREQEPDRENSKAGTQLGVETSISLSEGRESTSRLLAYTALVLVAPVLVYLAIVHSVQTAGESSSSHRTVAREEGNVRSLPESLLPAEQSAAEASPASATVPPESTSLTLVPSLILVPGKPGQTTSHSLVIHNRTSFEFTFEVEARDLVIRNGRPVFLTAGQLPDSVAANLLLAPRSVNVKAMQTAAVDVRVTVPSQTQVRGVLITLKGTDGIPAGADTVMTASLGTLISLMGPENTPAQTSDPGLPALANAVSFSVAQWLDEAAPEGLEPPPPAPETQTGTPAEKPVGSTQP
jgi:cytoskeletal protein RodZ